MSKQQGNNYWLTSGLLTLFQSLAGVLFSFTTFYLLVRMLGKDDWGALILFLSTTTFLEFIRNGITSNALIKFISFSKKEDHAAVISASFTINSILTICCIIFNFAFAGYLAELWNFPQLKNMFYLHSVVFLLSGLSNQLNCIEQANLSFRGSFVTAVTGQIVNLSFISYCFIFGIHIAPLDLVYIYILGAAAGLGMAYVFARRHLAFRYKIEWKWVKELFNYGKYSFGTSLGAMVFGSIDQWMLGALHSTSAAGAYNIAIRITNLVEVPTGTVARIVFPQSAKRMETEGKAGIKYLYEKSVGTILALLLPALLFLFVFAGYVVDFLAGEKYDDAIPILHVTILFCLFVPFARQFGTIMDSIGKPKLNFKLTAFMALVNVGLNFLFISKFGVIGAAYATLTSYVTGFVIGQTILRKQLDVNFLNAFVYAVKFYPEFFSKHFRLSRKARPASLPQDHS